MSGCGEKQRLNISLCVSLVQVIDKDVKISNIIYSFGLQRTWNMILVEIASEIGKVRCVGLKNYRQAWANSSDLYRPSCMDLKCFILTLKRKSM